MSKRKQVEEYVIKYISKIDKSGFNTKLYEDLFKSMNNKQFETFMQRLKDGKDILNLIVPHDSEVKIDLENNFRIAEELNIKFFQRVTTEDDEGNVFLTPIEFLIYHLPVKRLSQHAVKGISVGENTKKRNFLTGQLAGDSASSKLSFPEMELLTSMGINKSLTEITMARTGDVTVSNIYANKLRTNGKVHLKDLQPFYTGTQSKKTLKAYFKSAHIKFTG